MYVLKKTNNVEEYLLLEVAYHVDIIKVMKFIKGLKVSTIEEFTDEIENSKFSGFFNEENLRKRFYNCWFYKKEKERLYIKFKGEVHSFDKIDVLSTFLEVDGLMGLISLYSKVHKVELISEKRQAFSKHNIEKIEKSLELTKVQKKILLCLNQQLSNKVISKSGSAYLSASFRYLKQKTQIPSSTINYNIFSLENQGYIERIKRNSDLKNFKFNDITIYKLTKIREKKQETNRKSLESLITSLLYNKGYIRLSDIKEGQSSAKEILTKLVVDKHLLYVKPNKRLKKKYGLIGDEYVYIKAQLH